MLFAIENFVLTKAEREDTPKHVHVRMVSNALLSDRARDRILPEAFDKDTVNYHLREGLIDWHHESLLGKTPEIRARSILGKPVDFVWEDGLPVEYAYLTKAHPIVSESILPHLDADQPVFGASVGGKILETILRSMERVITKIHWNHTAITGRSYVMSPGSGVALVKAAHSPDQFLRFADMGLFGEYLYKAQEANTSVTDIANLEGSGALQPQSLLTPSSWNELVEDFLEAIGAEVIAPSIAGATLFFKAQGFGQDQSIVLGQKVIETIDHFSE